ncbi:MAG TPA: glycoside hydrolase family 3 C-terminal domain-containing protein, partial [bacterium]|nr:glycoside hydrolase family 3 C-terminal domain-containing protein [bacterium]
VNLDGKPAVTRLEKQIDYFWDQNAPIPGTGFNSFSVRWSGEIVAPKDGNYKLVLVNDSMAKLFVNGKLKINNWTYEIVKGKTASLDMKAGERYKIRLEYQAGFGGRGTVKLGWISPSGGGIARAVAAAKKSDVAVVIIGLDKRFEGEGRDRDNMDVPGLQNELVERVAAANPRTVVVLVNGTAMQISSWVGKVASIVEAWYPGEEGGRAIGEILFGDVNPSGKLPVTFPPSWEKSPAYANYPGKDGKVYYKEGVFVGYRYFDTKGIAPIFPFGHGLSYTQFKYEGLKINPAGGGDKVAEVSLTVKNVGKREGKEVVQLYVGDPVSSVPRPLRELKGIRKINLKPGESAKVSFTLDRRALSFYDVTKNAWVAEPGLFNIEVGSSSRDIRQKGTFTLKK